MRTHENKELRKPFLGHQALALWSAPILSFIISGLTWKFSGLEPAAALTLGIALWTALWWIFEAVPIPVASLVPLS
jgi:sodium-dependent dicarboxylate transporter 2/3/5